MIRIYGSAIDTLPSEDEMRARIGEQWLTAWKARHPSLRGEAALISLGGLFLLREAGANGILTYTSMGKPYFVDSDRSFSITHTKNVVICAVAPTGAAWRLGVDAENLGRTPSDRLQGLSMRWFGAEERHRFEENCDEKTFLSIWTRKEAFVKRSGEGLRQMSHLDTYALCEAQKAAFWTYWMGDTCVTLCTDENVRVEDVLFDREWK